jgi:CRISPR/Cas system-associated protein Csm6
MKKYYQSKKFWAGITTLVSGLSMFFIGEQSIESAFMTLAGGIFAVLTVFYTKETIE